MMKDKLRKLRLFQKAAIGTGVLFFGIMGLVILVAYSRSSGSTGLDMAKVQKLRYDLNHPHLVDNP
jgi:hypothetical protein